MTIAENARLLSVLEGHGQDFMNSFPSTIKVTKKRKNDAECISAHKKPRKLQAYYEEDEAWSGISKDLLLGQIPGEDEQEEESASIDFEQTDDEFTAETCEDNVVVFSEPGPKQDTHVAVSKSQMKAFMSSKISKLNSDSGGPSSMHKSSKDEEEDRTNAQNDALLHKLVHTKLLSGSLTTELHLTPAQRRKALAGRVLELSGEAKLGKGEKLVREAEKNQAAKRVREGLAHKQKERGKRELEEAKNLGNYHPTLKRVFETSGSGSSARKREKGLKMGIGKFSNGSLKLSRDDVKSAVGGHSRNSSSRGGGVRGRGRGRGRGSG